MLDKTNDVRHLATARKGIVKRAQYTEVALGVLLAAMLLGLAALIRLHPLRLAAAVAHLLALRGSLD